MMALAQPSLNSEGAAAPQCREKSLYYFIVLLTGSGSLFAAAPLFKAIPHNIDFGIRLLLPNYAVLP